MTAMTVVSKTLHNATRSFDKHLGARQSRAMKTLIRGILNRKTTVLQQLYNKDSTSTVNKFREGLSNHLDNVELQPIIDEKTNVLVAKAEKYNDWNILVGDATDIFKPHAKVMQHISRVRDGSTGLLGNGYVVYGININGITTQLAIKDPTVECIGSERRESLLKKSAAMVNASNTIAIFDRGHDDIGFIDMLQGLSFRYIVRGKKNRLVKYVATQETIKAGLLPLGRHHVVLEGDTICYAYVIQGTGKTPVILYSNVAFETDEECLQLYLKRRTIETDYKRLKSFGLEEVRLMSLRKITAIMLLIQYIIILGQSLYNEVTESLKTVPSKLLLHLKLFCEKHKLSINQSSLLTFISRNITLYSENNNIDITGNTLFGDLLSLRKLGCI